MLLITTLVVSFLVCCVLEVRCSYAGVVSGFQARAVAKSDYQLCHVCPSVCPNLTVCPSVRVFLIYLCNESILWIVLKNKNTVQSVLKGSAGICCTMSSLYVLEVSGRSILISP